MVNAVVVFWMVTGLDQSRTGSDPAQPPTQWGKTARVWSWPLTTDHQLGPHIIKRVNYPTFPLQVCVASCFDKNKVNFLPISTNIDRHDIPITYPFSALTLTDPELSHYDSPRWPGFIPRTLQVGYASGRVAAGQLVWLSAVNSTPLLHDAHSFICNRR